MQKSAACQQKRQQLESARAAKVTRIRNDIQKIVKREVEFARQVIDVIVPVSIAWDADAWDRVKAFVPVRVEMKSEVSSETEVVDDAQSL